MAKNASLSCRVIIQLGIPFMAVIDCVEEEKKTMADWNSPTATLEEEEDIAKWVENRTLFLGEKKGGLAMADQTNFRSFS